MNSPASDSSSAVATKASDMSYTFIPFSPPPIKAGVYDLCVLQNDACAAIHSYDAAGEAVAGRTEIIAATFSPDGMDSGKKTKFTVGGSAKQGDWVAITANGDCAGIGSIERDDDDEMIPVQLDERAEFEAPSTITSSGDVYICFATKESIEAVDAFDKTVPGITSAYGPLGKLTVSGGTTPGSGSGKDNPVVVTGGPRTASITALVGAITFALFAKLM
jgi:hypothetical protein